MADAAIRMTAAEPALDLPPGTIAEAMRGNRDAAVAAILEGDATAKLIMGYITPGHDFWGIHGELLTKLRKDASKDDKAELPSNAQQLSVHLKKIAPALRSMGYVVSYPRRGNGGRRTVSIRHEQDA